MRRLAFLITIVVLPTGGVAEACGRARACHSRHHRAVYQPVPTYYPVCQPVPTYSHATAYYPRAYAAPQTTYAYAPPVASQPTLARPTTAARPSPNGVQPLYNYAAANQAQPAYYYTYDSSGKLVISQWMDFLFRGGRAAGMPTPPLPIIGALRGR